MALKYKSGCETQRDVISAATAATSEAKFQEDQFK